MLRNAHGEGDATRSQTLFSLGDRTIPISPYSFVNSSSLFTHSYALLIGVGETASPRWSLPVTVKDDQTLQSVLTDPELCAYPNNQHHVRLLRDARATCRDILEDLDWLKGQVAAEPEATVVVLLWSWHF